MKKHLLTVTLGLLCHFARAQAPENIAVPSADNSFLGKSGMMSGSTDVSVDLYTGTAQVNIPIAKLNSKELSIPVSLSYAGGRGIRLQEYAGTTGLGWQLNAGGNISRVVRGYPDELPKGYIGANHSGQKVADWAKNGTALPSDIVGSTTTPPTSDGEPDLFYIKTPYFSVQFTLDENGNAIFNSNTGIKIDLAGFYLNNGGVPIVVTDDQGNRYYFLSTEKSETKLYGTTYTFPVTWYLEKIVTFNNSDSVLIDYVKTTDRISYTHYQQTRTVIGSCESTDATPVNYAITYPCYVRQIVTLNGKLEFKYAYDRRDLANAARLTDIKMFTRISTADYIEYSDFPWSEIRNYHLNYSYFGDPSNVLNVLRLKLNNITVAGNTPKTATPLTLKTFTYNETESLGPRDSQSFDFWGYYTFFPLIGPPGYGNTDPMKTPYIREPYEPRTKAGVLSKITDIAGGTWEINYELNDYYDTHTASNVPVGGLRVKRLAQTLPTGENLYTDYEYTDTTGNSSGQILSRSYRNLVAIFGNGANKIFSEIQTNIYDLNGTFAGYSSVKVKQKNGGYTISTFNNFSDFPDEFNYLNSPDPETAPSILSSTSTAYKRGLPKSQTVFDAGGKKISEDIYTYSTLTSPVATSWAYQWYSLSYSLCNSSYISNFSSKYAVKVENYRLTQTISRSYDQLDQNNYVQTTTNIIYGSDNRLVKTSATSSSKDPANFSKVQTFYYAADPSIPMLTANEQTVVNNLVSKNRLAALVHQTVQNNDAISQIHYSFGTSATNKNYLMHTDAYKGSKLVKQEFYNYDDARSTIVSSHSAGGRTTSYQYDNNGCFVLAQVENAEPNEIFYEGFEINPYMLFGHTGRCLQQSFSDPYQVSFPLPNNKSYIIQWWSWDNNNAKWIMHEEPYTGPRTISGLIDDIRIFPVGALMTSYSYDRLVGKTGEIDPTGRTTTYWYDGLGRQSVMRDNDNNIISKNCYTYAGQTEDCAPTIFFNDELNYKVTRNNCTNGSESSELIYKVPANKYRSTISQADANAHAMVEFIEKGQAYANDPANGATCMFYNQRIDVLIKKYCCDDSGTEVLYTIPARTYSSSVSQQEVDDWVSWDISTLGQDYANQRGACQNIGQPAYLMGQNMSCATVRVTLFPKDGSPQIAFNLGPNSFSSNLGPVPTGDYDVQITPDWCKTRYIVGIGDQSQVVNGGNTANFYNLPISPCSYMNIWIMPN